MPGLSRDEILRSFGLKSQKHALWTDYAAYLMLQDQGLRADAFKRLAAFLTQAQTWSFDRQRAFVAWLCDQVYRANDADSRVMPTPLAQQLVLPTLHAWTEQEPHDPVPHRWLGILFYEEKHLERALELDPDDQPARLCLVNRIVNGLEYSVHHVPEGYIGDPDADLEEAKAARQHLAYIVDERVRQALLHELDEVQHLIEDWIAFEQDGGGNFCEWCKQHGRTWCDWE